MRVWIINPFDELPGEPGRPGRFWSLCHVLAEQGHDVTWWTADFSHRRKARRCAEPLGHGALGGHALPAHSPAPSFSLPAPSLPHSPTPFHVRLIPVTPYHANVGLARLRSHRVFGRNLEKALRAETAAGRRPDRIVTSWPPVEAGEVAVRLGREWNVPVTIDVMDAWPEAFAAFIPGPAWVAKGLLAPWRRRARAVFSAAERVSGVGRAFLDYARSLGASGPTHLTYLGAWFESGVATAVPGRADLQGAPVFLPASDSAAKAPSNNQQPTSPSPPPSLPHSLIPSSPSPLRLLYLGNIGRSQDLATVIEGLALVRARGHDVRLDIAGSGEREAELIEAIKTAGVADAVRLHGFLSGEALGELTARAHIGVNPVRGESLIACPYKVADYLAAGLPVLNSLPGELAELLAEYGAGRSFRVGAPETFAAAVAAWVTDPASVATMSAGARSLGEACFAREKTYPALARFVAGRDE